MSDALAILPATPPASSGKNLNELDNAPAEGHDAGEFASLVESLMPVPPPAPPAISGDLLPGVDTPLPDVEPPTPDAAAAAAPGTPLAAAPFTPQSAPQSAPQKLLPEAAPVLPPAADSNLSRWTTGTRAAAQKSVLPALAADTRDAAIPDADDTPDTAGRIFHDFMTEAGSGDAKGASPQGPGGGLAAPGSGLAAATPAPLPVMPDTTASALHGAGMQSERTGAAEAPRLTLDSKLPLASPAFAERFAEQVTVLVEHGIKHARISLNPADLGPIEVRISFHQDEANVQFASHHGAVRDAMTEALPRLREMMDSAGVKLGDSGVFAQLPQREPPAGGQPGAAAARDPLPAPWDETPDAPVRAERQALRLVDAYV